MPPPTWTLTPLLTVTRAAETILGSYFSDGGCSNYVLSVHCFTNCQCYGFQYSGTNSAGITDCDGFSKNTNCACYIYNGGGCLGASQLVDFKNANNRCASNYGHGFESMKVLTSGRDMVLESRFCCQVWAELMSNDK